MGFKFIKKEEFAQLPKSPGIYCFKDKNGEILYIGKAINIRERVKNHFPSRSEGERRTNVLRTHPVKYREAVILPKAKLFNRVKQIGYIKTDLEFAEPSAHLTSHPASQGSTIEALILEANLIKKYQPKYNIVWRDDKNYFFVGVTKEDFPRIFWTHQIKRKLEIRNLKFEINYVGPFVDGKALKETLKILRKVFPYRTCKTLPKKPCLWYQLQRCPAPCFIEFKFQTSNLKNICQRNAKNIMKILQGKKNQVLKDLKREMKKVAKIQDFEKAAKIRDQITYLEKVLAHSKILEPLEIAGGENWSQIQKMLQKILKVKEKISRIEAYDVSNIQGQKATGSMVTFINGKPNKNLYRKFKIKIAGKPDDVAMIKEVLTRRFKHEEWGLPNLILIDGGIAQLNAALQIKDLRLQPTHHILPPLVGPLKIKEIRFISLAKKRSAAKPRTKLRFGAGENKLFIEGEKPSTRAKLGAGPVPHRNKVSGAGKPILLKNLPREIFNLILQLRDEAHRFARKYHLKLREVDLFKNL